MKAKRDIVELDTGSGIGYQGQTLTQMLEGSEQIFSQTGRCHGINDLALKAKDPIRFEKIASRLRGAMVGARETAINISASPIVREVGGIRDASISCAN